MIRSKLHIIFVILLSIYACGILDVDTKNTELRNIQLKVSTEKDKLIYQDISFLVKADKGNKELSVLLENGLITKLFTTSTNEILTIDKKHFVHAGLYTISIYDAGSLLTSRDFTLEAREITDPIEVYAGPNSLVVGSKEQSMLTTIPADKLDNAILEDKKITYRATGAKVFYKNNNISHLVSNTIFTSSNETGKVIVGLSHNKKSSREQQITQTADWGTDFKLKLISHHPYADNRQYSQITTTKILDKYGNTVPDGTFVEFIVKENEKLIGIYKALSIDGIAKVYIKNPAIASTYVISAHIENRALSNSIQISFRNIISKINYKHYQFQKAIKVGPLTSDLGQMIPDGTPVELTIDGKNYVQECYEGYVIFSFVKLGIRKPDAATIKVAGIERKIKLKK